MSYLYKCRLQYASMVGQTWQLSVCTQLLMLSHHAAEKKNIQLPNLPRHAAAIPIAHQVLHDCTALAVCSMTTGVVFTLLACVSFVCVLHV